MTKGLIHPNECEVFVFPVGTVESRFLGDLNSLATEFENSSLAVSRTSFSVPGVKDGGLTIAIAIAGVTVSTISTVISVLAFWQSKNPTYSINLKMGRLELTIDNLSRQEVLEVANRLSATDLSTALTVRVCDSN